MNALYNLKGVLVFSFIGLFLSSCQPKTAMEKLQEKINAVLSEQKGVFAVAFKDLSNRETLLIHEHEVFHAASTMKTPVMIEVYKQVAEGKLSLSDSILIKNEFKSVVDGSSFSLNPKDDSEFELYKSVGRKRTLYSLVYDMITASSNVATNLVIEQVDPATVTRTMRELGAKDIQVLRGVEDQKAFDKGMINTTTAYDLMMIFEKLAKGETVNAEASHAMIKILLDQKFKEIIPAKLPANIKVAHKTGNIKGVQHDSGIVFLPDGRKYVLVLLSKDLKNESESIKAMATVSELIYQYVNSEK